MSVQTSYASKTNAGLPGLIFSPQDQDIWSAAVEGAAGIGFGLGVSRGTDPEKQVVIGGAAPMGITVRDVSHIHEDASGNVGYAVTETAGILRRGYIYAICADGCTPGNGVKANATTGALSVATGNDIAGATWESVTAAGELGIVRIA